MVSIPKVKESESIDQYRHISLEKVMFKINTKVFVDRLSQVLPHIISKEKKGFINGRCIKDCVFLTYEVANLIHNRSLGGNFMLKVDIVKSFDTLSWFFLLKVLNQFGFCDKFYLWIKNIM